MSTTITNLPETSKVNGSDYLVLDQPDKTVKSTVSNFLTDTGVVLATQLKDTDGADLIQSSNGNTVQEELNNNLLNDREQWRRSLAEAGLTLVDGSFEEGATLNNNTDAVWYIAGGQCYTWDGAFPKAVPADSTPTSTGGVGPSSWVSVGDAALRANLSSSILPVRNNNFSLRDVLSLADFIPANANKDYLADTEFNAALAYAKANNIGNILLPSWMTFKLSTTELSKNTFDKIRIYCDRPAVYDENAGGTIWTDDARVFNIGVDDGNPDSTGFTRSITLENIQFGRTYSTEASAAAVDTSDVAVNVVNTTHFRMKGCRSFGFKQGGFRPQGGNVLIDVDDFEAYGLTGKNANTGYGYAIQRGSSYWGTFVMRLRNIHGFQYKGFMYVGPGRDIIIENPVAENMQDSMFHLEGSTEVYSLNISNAYGELIRGAYFRADNFTGSIYKLNIKGFEAHEAGAGGYAPVLSTLNRARVLRSNISGVICSDSVLDAQLGTTTSGRLTESVMFQGTIAKTTAYDDDLFKMYSAFQNTDKLGLAGTFNTLNTTGNAPYNWTYINGVWTTSTAAVRSGSSLKCSTGGNYDKASISLSKPNSRTRFALAVTFAGPITVKVNGSVTYQSTASGWNTSIINFIVDDTSTSFTITVGPVTNATDTIEIAEMRVWEIGSADATEVGWTTGLTQKAIRMTLIDVI